MPELPEVETVLRGLERVLAGRRIKGVKLYRKNLRNNFPRDFVASIAGQKIVSFVRRAKYMLLELSNKKILIIHLGMTGSFVVYPSSQKEKMTRGKHDHVQFDLDDGTTIFYRDPRRFGVMDVTDKASVSDHPLLVNLGVEPLDKTFSGAALYKVLQGRKLPIKQAIMDQKIVVGVGNIYASEALFASGIDPRRSSSNLTAEECALLVKSIKNILKKAIAAGGSTLRDYRQVGGETGNFQSRFAVYDLEGFSCRGCLCNVDKTGGIKRIVQGGRSTFYCATKQG